VGSLNFLRYFVKQRLRGQVYATSTASLYLLVQKNVSFWIFPTTRIVGRLTLVLVAFPNPLINISHYYSLYKIKG